MTQQLAEAVQALVQGQAAQAPEKRAMRPEADGLCAPGCEICGGVGYVYADVAPGHPDFGKLRWCPNNPARKPVLLQQAGLDWEPPAWEDITPRSRKQELAMRAMGRAGKQGGGVWLWGPPGVGKTFLLRAFVWREVQRREARYVTMLDLLDSLRDAVNGGLVVETRQRWARLPVLALDEPEKANAGTEFARANVFEILNRRYEGGKHLGLVTVVASNEPPSVLGAYLASRFMARREGFFTVHIDDLEDQRR